MAQLQTKIVLQLWYLMVQIADVRHEVATINTVGQKLWEIAGLSSDPGGLLNVSITFNATGGTVGTLSWNINYAVN